MDSRKFIAIVIDMVARYANSHREQSEPIRANDVYIVWLSKVLQNNKALAATTLRDGLYFEVTYNGDKKELYLDVYRKAENVKFTVDDASAVYAPDVEKEN